MYSVSKAWVSAQENTLAPEGFVELSCYVPALKDTLVYTKGDLLSFTHQQTGSLVSGELPKNHIEFTLDNSDGKWDPSNPTGLERYLSERLKITVRYGFDINGEIEWIPGGIFYLSEWRTSPNGIEASFTARDIFEYMIDKKYTGAINGTLYDVATSAILVAGIPKDTVVVLADELKNYSVGDVEYTGDESVAEILQKCANAAGCVMYQDRAGVLRIEKAGYLTAVAEYKIPKNLSFSYPEIEFYRPMRNVSVSYLNGGEVLYQFSGSGETQTVNNKFISTKNQAITIAKWVCDSLRTRKQVNGEFRGDPRIDLFDRVMLDTKYGEIDGVVLTDIKCSFNGAFRTTFKGYVHGSGTAVFAYSGDVYSGEVV